MDREQAIRSFFNGGASASQTWPNEGPLSLPSRNGTGFAASNVPRANKKQPSTMRTETLAESTYVQLIAEPGRLRFKLTAEGVEELNDNLAAHPEWGDGDHVWALLDGPGTGGILGNWQGRFTDDASTWGHMSEAPMFADTSDDDELSYEMNGPQPAKDARLWYFNEYAIRAMVDDLKEHGEVIFTELT